MATTVPGVAFIAYQDDEFHSIIGNHPDVLVLADNSSVGYSDQALFHEACIYHQPSRSVFVTSNQLLNADTAPNPHTSNKHVKLFRVYDPGHGPASKVSDVNFPGIEGAMLNGGVNLDADSILLCAQGSKDSSSLAGIIKLDVSPETGKAEPVAETVISLFHGIPFNSVNDVITHPEDQSIWFTDPAYGYHQGIRQRPQLPQQVYRFDPHRGSVRAMAHNFQRPNGLCFSPDLHTLYVTDTGAIHGSPVVEMDLTGPSHIFAFDVATKPASSFDPSQPLRAEPFLTNRRLFAFTPGRIPDGIKCDMLGNVYSGCGDGINVWNPSGVLIGTFQVDGGVANFCFGEKGVIYACNETRLLRFQLDPDVRGALLRI